MKLNHVSFTVTEVPETRKVLKKYFGLRGMEGVPEDDSMAFLVDDDGLLLALFKAEHETDVQFPAGFHIGFMQESEERVNQINERLKDDGFKVPAPRRLHGSWTFYFRVPGGFTIEVLR